MVHIPCISYASSTNSVTIWNLKDISSPRHDVNLDITNQHPVSCSFFYIYISLFHVGKHSSIFIYCIITLSTKILHLHNTTPYQGMEKCLFSLMLHKLLNTKSSATFQILEILSVMKNVTSESPPKVPSPSLVMGDNDIESLSSGNVDSMWQVIKRSDKGAKDHNEPARTGNTGEELGFDLPCCPHQFSQGCCKHSAAVARMSGSNSSIGVTKLANASASTRFQSYFSVRTSIKPHGFRLVMCLSSPAISTPSTEHHSKNYIQ